MGLFLNNLIIMNSLEYQQNQHHQSESECPECRKQYSSSGSSSESSSEERIVIPLRRDLLNTTNPQIQAMVKTLQGEVQNLKKSNTEKDRIIDDLKKQIDHKMTHYMLYGQINKHSEELNRLRTEITQQNICTAGSGLRQSQFSHVKAEDIRNIVREETKRAATERDLLHQEKPQKRNISGSHSKHQKDFMRSKPKIKRHTSPELLKFQQQSGTSFGNFNEYFEPEYCANPRQSKGIFKISEAKRKIGELQEKLKIYEEQMVWMSNFVTTFIRTMQNLAYKKYQEQIIIPEWSLKKKAKTSWRYLKHLFKFLYESDQFLVQ